MTPHPKDMTEELIKKITSLDKVCEMIHLPIQSGDNTILKSMNRRYTRKEYLHRISLVKKYFEKNKPQKLYSISTDIIVGFPQETKSRLENSAKVMRKAQYDMVYFGQFSPRPGTAAWQMKDNVKKQEKARREKCLNEILKKTAYANNKKYIGTFQDVLVEKEKNGIYFGKTRTFKNVKAIITKDYCPELVEGSLIGQIIPVKITAANIWNLEGEFYKKKKVVVILGPTASGKSSAAIKLAKKFNGEIISADSRQIYKGMDIGSGKITKTEQKMIPHYMIDIVSPKTDYNVAKFKKQSLKHIEGILSRGKTPIIAGGTGFWIKAIVDDAYFPEVKPDWKLRQKLEKKSTSELFKKLKKTDPQRAKNIDAKNPVRLIRAIEICVALGRVPKKENKENKKYEFLQIGIKRTKENIHERIKMNVEKRFKKGMVKEVENLHEEGVSWKRLRSFGLSYSLIPDFLQGKIDTKEILKEKIYLAEKNYAKRQMTWFQRDKRIKWLADYDNIEKETKKFLK
jgi:tRNA dimethylallyltransferase